MSTAEKVSEIRNTLLPATLEYAVNKSAFYAETIGNTYREVRSVCDLKQLPVIERRTVFEHYDAITCDPQPDDLMTFSSGTSGQVLVLRRSRDEVAQVKKCWKAIERVGRYSKERRILRFVQSAYIDEAPVPGNYVLLPGYVTRDNFAVIHRVLSESSNNAGQEPPISVLLGDITFVSALTLYFAMEGISMRDFGIEHIGTNGAHVSERWRALLNEYWHASVADVYSLSEFIGSSASPCELCGYNHFALPTLVPEVVHPTTNQPVDSGQGLLVLTNLYPFAQRQILIRYLTGDIVEKGPTCARDDFGFRFQGRVSQIPLTVVDGEARLLLAPVDVHDCLDALPDVDRTLRFLDVFPPEIAKLAGRLRFQQRLETTSSDGLGVRLEISLSYLPDSFPSRVGELRDWITSRLLEQSKTLEQLVRKGEAELTIRFHPPGTIPGSEV